MQPPAFVSLRRNHPRLVLRGDGITSPLPFTTRVKGKACQADEYLDPRLEASFGECDKLVYSKQQPVRGNGNSGDEGIIVSRNSVAGAVKLLPELLQGSFRHVDECNGLINETP